MNTKLELKKWVVTVVNTNKEWMSRGIYIDEKICSSYQIAQDYMVEMSKKYQGVKNVEKFSNDEMYVEFEDYFIQMKITEIVYRLNITD